MTTNPRKSCLNGLAAALAIALAGTLPASAADTASTPSSFVDPATVVAAIDRLAQTAVLDGISPGLQIAVFKDGAPMLVKAYGQADLELPVPVTNGSVFRIGSVSKQFCSAAILKLQEEGKLSIDDKLSKYYPKFPSANDITIRQMLLHTSGIPSYGDDSNGKMEHRSTDGVVDFLAARPTKQDFRPGTSWTYSNAGYFILGAIVEKVEGEPLAAVLKRRFFTPLGMSHTALDDETEIVSGRAAGYAGDGPGKFKNPEFISMSFPGGAGAMRSSASDLARWNAALFGGRVLKPETFAAMTAPGTLANGQGTGALLLKKYGQPSEYGFGIETSSVEGHRKVSHGGGIDGFSASLSEFPSDRLTIVVLSNTIGKGVGAGKLAEQIDRIALGVAPE